MHLNHLLPLRPFKSYGWWGGGVGWGGGPCDYCVTPSPNWTWILIWTTLGLVLGLGRLDLGLGLDNIFKLKIYVES